MAEIDDALVRAQRDLRATLSENVRARCKQCLTIEAQCRGLAQSELWQIANERIDVGVPALVRIANGFETPTWRLLCRCAGASRDLLFRPEDPHAVVLRIGEHVDERMEALGLSIRALSRRSRVSAPHLCDVLRGIKAPGLGVLARIGVGVGVEPCELVRPRAGSIVAA